jgi:protein gp37
MGDVFEDRRDLDAPRTKLWALIEATSNLDWLLLTKRPENIAKLVPWGHHAWPPNVWLGVTAETQQRADERIPLLLQYQAAVRFVSAEPLLEAISLKRYLSGNRRVDWVITGGESGAGARPSDPDWFRQLRDECVQHRVSFFFKQWGNHAPSPSGQLVRLRSKKQGGRLLDGREWNQFPGTHSVEVNLRRCASGIKQRDEPVLTTTPSLNKRRG